MLPKKYHAIAFISILVMLLLLGLHLLGIGYSGGQATAKTAALARNSSSSSSINTALSQNQVYRHPIVYDKLTGATNNQINDVLGAKQPPNDYPIDHYQQQQQQQQQASQQQQQLNQFNQLPQDDFFNNIHRQSSGFPPPPPHPLSHHMHPPPPMVPPMMTTQSPMMGSPGQQQQGRQPLGMPLPPLPPPAPNQRTDGMQNPTSSGNNSPPPNDSLPSASSLTNNGARTPASVLINGTQQQQQHQQQPFNLQQQQQQPIYYTPPIFAYNNFDQNRPLGEPQLSGGPFGVGPQQPPIGLPEAPMSIDEYNARQARLRQINQLTQQPNLNNINQGEVSQSDRYGKQAPANGQPHQLQFSSAPQTNLLADPQQQQRHKQQMLDRQLLFGNPNAANFPPTSVDQFNGNTNNLTNNYYPDPALYRQPMSSGPQASIRAPYAHNMVGSPGTGADLESQFGLKQSAQNRIMPLNNRIDPNSNQAQQQQQQQATKLGQPPDTRQVIKSSNPAPLMSSGQQQQLAQVPLCARQQVSNELRNLEMVNSSAFLPALFCNEDPEYPTKEIMRALETYANERSIEQLLPQPLVQIQMAQRGDADTNRNNPLAGVQRQLTLDSLQPAINPLKLQPDTLPGQLVAFDEQRPRDNQQVAGQPPQSTTQLLFPSANYEPMCRSSVYMAQPRRAKNLLGQWKVVVNLPGHKYRGIAVSQMMRIEECSRPNAECTTPPGGVSNVASPSSGRSSVPVGGSTTIQSSVLLLPKSRCLQHYENQRLVAWSHQQGLHLDIFRVPIACSCHIRR